MDRSAQIRALSDVPLDWRRIVPSRESIPVGYVIEFRKYQKNFRFEASDGRAVPFRCDRIDGVSNLSAEECIQLRSNRLCPKTRLLDEENQPLIHTNQEKSLPLLTAREWYDAYQFDVVINGGWFLAREYSYFSYRYPCSSPKGIHISDGVILAAPETVDRIKGSGQAASRFDALVVQGACDKERVDVLTLPARSDLQGVRHAVAGFRLLDSGVPSDRMREASNSPMIRKARTGVGVNENTVWFVVVQPGTAADGRGGILAEEFATLFQQLGARDAINLDNGGSSQLHFRDPAPPHTVVESLPGDVIPNDLTTLDETARKIPGSRAVYRPVPNVFAAYRVNR